MKKYLIILLTLILPFLDVFAEESATFTIECNDKASKGSNITCDVVVSYNEFTFSSLEFGLDTSLNVSFENSIGKLHKNENIYQLIFDKEVEPVTKIGSVIINNVDEGKIVVNNIKFLDEEKVVYQIQDFFKTINILKDNLDSNCYLNGIIVNGVPVKGFDKDKLVYDPVYVDNQSVFVDAIKSSAKSSMMGLGTIRVRENRDVTRVITVIAENGSKKEYTLVLRNAPEPVETEEVTLPDTLSNDAKLNMIEIHENGEKLSFDFKKEQTSYVVNLKDKNTTSLLIEAELSDNKANFVDGFGPREVNLDYGLNKILIKVVAEDKTENVYTINITREDMRSSESLLSSLKINEKDIILNDNELNYLMTVGGDVERTNVSLVPKSEKSTIEYEDIDLHEGENTLVIKVTAENGHQSEYQIKIVKQKEENIPFENIIIKDYPITFAKEKYEYDLYYKEIPEKLDIQVNPLKIVSDIRDNENLKDGSVVRVKVIDNGTIRNYAFNIHIKSSGGASNIICYIFFGGSILLLALSVFNAMRMKKKNFTK